MSNPIADAAKVHVSDIIASATLPPSSDQISVADAITWARRATRSHAVAVASIYRKFGYRAANHVIQRCTVGFPGNWYGFNYAVSAAVNPTI